MSKLIQGNTVDIEGVVKGDIRNCSACKEDKPISRIFSLGTEEQRDKFNLYREFKNPGILLCEDCCNLYKVEAKAA